MTFVIICLVIGITIFLYKQLKSTDTKAQQDYMRKITGCPVDQCPPPYEMRDLWDHRYQHDCGCVTRGNELEVICNHHVADFLKNMKIDSGSELKFNSNSTVDFRSNLPTITIKGGK